VPSGEFGKGLNREYAQIVIDRLHSVKRNMFSDIQNLSAGQIPPVWA
jgi:hypothetical protein